jgi:hypothetical protein
VRACESPRKKEREDWRTHLLGQGVQVREGFESPRFVSDFLEQPRVLYGIDELVGGLLRESPRCGGKCTQGMTRRLGVSVT